MIKPNDLANNNLEKKFLKFIISVLTPYKLHICCLILLAAISASYGTINSYLIKVLIDAIEVTDNREPLVKIVFWPAAFFVLNFEAHHISWRILNYLNFKVAPTIKRSIISRLFIYVHRHSYRFYQENFSGAIANNIITLADNIENITFNISMPIIRGFIQAIFALVSVYFVNPIFSLVLFVWISVFVGISALYSNRIQSLSDEYAKSQTILSGKVIDSITNSINLKLFAREKFEVEDIQKYINSVTDKFCVKEKFLFKFSLIQGLSITILVGIIMITLIKCKINNLVTTGDFAFILGLVLYVTDNIWFLTDQINEINDIIGKCNQSLKHISIPHEIQDIPHAKPLLIQDGEIIFNQIRFNYKGERNLFNIESLTIPAGQKIGLVGHSGSGKSTFVNLILRLFDVTSGQITIDGQNIRHVTQSSLRSLISIIPQDPALFHRTLLENIRYGKLDATDEEVIDAAKKAYAHEFIQILPQGYNALVGERGIKLSGGQRQRVAIARAILKNAPILILDEATSQLDSITENFIQKSLWNLMEGKTTIVIAHRLSTLLDMDYILVFEEGKIIEVGTHKSLLVQGKRYQSMWEAQVKKFND